METVLVNTNEYDGRYVAINKCKWGHKCKCKWGHVNGVM